MRRTMLALMMVVIAGVFLITTSVATASPAGVSHAVPAGTQLVGVTWRGAPQGMQLRVLDQQGRWSAWHVLEHGDHAPDPARTENNQHHSRIASDPVWVGSAVRVQVRVMGARPARAIRIISIDARALQQPPRRDGARPLRIPGVGFVYSRTQWGAASPKQPPAYADGVKGVVVHHTDNVNGYTCAQVPELLRGIQRYHMRTQGWNDIGYNFLIDRCGRIWEGREGGINQAVIGAHTYGFNTGTSGIALIGNYTAQRPTSRARAALRRLVAWRLDVAHVRPDATMLLTSSVTSKFQRGQRVRVRAVSGHRDLFSTSCPGSAEYKDLHALAAQAWRSAGAKVANITTSFALRGVNNPVQQATSRVTARAVAPWATQYTAIRLERISSGEVLAVQGGRGVVRTASFTLPTSTSIPPWDLRVVVNGATRSGSRARPALVLVQEVPLDPELVVTAAPQPTVTPNADGIDDEITLTYTLLRNYRLQAQLVDPATNTVVATLLSAQYVGPTGSEPRTLQLPLPDTVPAGAYVLRLQLPGDPAGGRSVRDFPLTIVR